MVLQVPLLNNSKVLYPHRLRGTHSRLHPHLVTMNPRTIFATDLRRKLLLMVVSTVVAVVELSKPALPKW
jgi:hypothetical protein